MTKYDLIKQILEKVDEFWEDPNRIDKRLSAFSLFLTSEKCDQSNHLEYIQSQWSKSASLGYLIGKMCRYGRYYNRELLRHTEFSTPEEFGLAASLLHGKTPKKSELLSREIVEVPTGMAIIKRLVYKGIMMEINDSDDKRAMRIGLTPYGRQKVLEAFEVLSPLNSIISEPLNQNEISTLIDILTKLDTYHNENHIYIREKLVNTYENNKQT